MTFFLDGNYKAVEPLGKVQLGAHEPTFPTQNLQYNNTTFSIVQRSTAERSFSALRQLKNDKVYKVVR